MQKLEFRDEKEEQEFQKMVIHFGHEGAVTALLELRKIKDKPASNTTAAAASGTVAPSTPKAAGPSSPLPKGLISLEEAQRKMKESLNVDTKSPASPAYFLQTVLTPTQSSPGGVLSKGEREKARNLALSAAAPAVPESAKSKEEMEALFLEDAQYDFVDGMRDAIERGVDLDCEDANGDNALIIGSSNGSIAAVALLLKLRCRKNHRSNPLPLFHS